MKIKAHHDPDTIGLACFWNAPLRGKNAPAFMKVHCITIVLIMFVVSIEWGYRDD